MGLAFRLAAGVGFIGVLFLSGCASTAVADTEIDPDCPYLSFLLRSPVDGNTPEKRRANDNIQRPYREKLAAELERVGFKELKSLWIRLDREGFTELGAFWARLAPQLIEEGRNLLPGRETAEYEKITAKLTPHDGERVGQIQGEENQHTWRVESTVLDLGEMLAWSWSMKKRPTVLDGVLRRDLFKVPEDENPLRVGTGIDALRHGWKSDFGIMAAAAAENAAAMFLPHARQLCADINATLLEEESKLERIRDQLTEEIIRVRERRAEQEKRLKLEVEQ
jgi:hypothetical protein